MTNSNPNNWTARDLLLMIDARVENLRNKACAGGDEELRFDLHADVEDLIDVFEILDRQDFETSQP